jgi:hypothetical protein
MRCNCLNVRVIKPVDLSVAYYNSKHQVKAMLARVQGLISDVTARDWREPVPQLSQLTLAYRNGKPRAIRDRFAPEEYQRLVEAAQAGASKKGLAAAYGISRRSIDRMLAVRGSSASRLRA